MKVLFVTSALFALFYQSDGFKVLGVLAIPGSSHFAIGNAILKSLHEAGHKVTAISTFPKKKPLANYRDISTHDILERSRKGKRLQTGVMNLVLIEYFVVNE